ncbi:glucose-1-phosphate thymidylyltransferase RfbA [Thermosulfurimonas sp. F29]|uniref:glucose-1-phosphate thymidylyltransferase RfbA n=1 Tax=Thermosulfurimonas sp. F29 TaxID=2867247 RepID=UPI001C82F660|nr:glucose-1-phosphate thymidylyltransferase RfbA [Thermosulfurimonas sp. F29]
MKAVILAGGRGTRLFPITVAVNKHLLPVYNKPMIYYPLSILMLMGLRDIIIVLNGEDLPAFKKLLGNGEHLGIRLKYVVQEAPLGLAHALKSTASLLEGQSVCLVLGDNIFFGHGLPALLKKARREVEEGGGAAIFVYQVHDPERYGVAEFDEKGRVLRLEEKPRRPSSNWAVVGLYFYDSQVWDFLRLLKPSPRGEYEITGINQIYLEKGLLKAYRLGRGFTWFDAGTPESFLEASEFVAVYEKRSGKMLACPEEIALANGWISSEEILSRCNMFGDGLYSQYLKRLIEEHTR